MGLGVVELGILIFICGSFFIIVLFLVSAMKIVPENKRLSIFRLGRYIKEVGPGLVFLVPFVDRAEEKDVQDQVKQLQEDDRIWGAIGNTLTAVQAEGQIEISGENWNATSKNPIPPNTKVRITRVILEVEQI